MSRANNFNAGSYGIRLLAATVLVFATYNPSTYSFIHWATADFASMPVQKLFVGVVLLIGWVMFIRAAMSSLGAFGLLLASAFFGTLIWALADWGVLPIKSASAAIYVAEFVLAAVLATGMSWSHIRRRVSGQIDTDEIET